MLFGDNGIITKAQAAKFRQEMAEIKESINLKKTETAMSSTSNSNTPDTFTKVKISDANNWDEYLIKEIIMWGDYQDRLGISNITNEYVKQNWESILGLLKDEEGNIQNMYLVDAATANGKENAYIYDANVDIVYKIESTTIWVRTVHSVEELDGERVTVKNVERIQAESEFVTVGSISYYEPNLKNFEVENTKVVYYNIANVSDIQTLTAKEYINQNKPRTIEKDGKTYVFHDYNETGDNSKVWGNIVVENTGLVSKWVWIPRYAYKVDSTNKIVDIQFITVDNKLADGTDAEASGYTIHTAFEDGKRGIWVSKYEPSKENAAISEDMPYYLPDLTNFNPDKTYAEVFDNSTKQFKETKIKDIKSVAEFSTNNKWFDYKNNIWANIKVVGDYDMESWWVWIPRYAYSIVDQRVDLIFVDLNNQPLDGTPLPENFVVHPAFLEDGQTSGGKKGIWVSKYEPQASLEILPMTENVNPPNMKGYNVDGTYIECWDSDSSSFKEQTLRSILASNSVINSDNIVTEVHIDYSKIKGIWYNYKEKKWANIKVVGDDNKESWWVWIPRYAYNITGTSVEIIYISANNKILNTEASWGNEDLPANYIPHPAFNTQGATEGIWASKYEPQGTISRN